MAIGLTAMDLLHSRDGYWSVRRGYHLRLEFSGRLDSCEGSLRCKTTILWTSMDFRVLHLTVLSDLHGASSFVPTGPPDVWQGLFFPLVSNGLVCSCRSKFVAKVPSSIPRQWARKPGGCTAVYFPNHVRKKSTRIFSRNLLPDMVGLLPKGPSNYRR